MNAIGTRPVLVESPGAAGDSTGAVTPSKALAKFLSLVCGQTTAELLDLGPVIGSNITFLAERVACKIHVEDLYAHLDRHAQQGALDRLPEFLEGRFALLKESIDAVLCWDVFDFLVPAPASVLAAELTRVLRPGGALLAFFGAGGSGVMRYTKYLIEDEAHLRHRSYPAAFSRQRVLQNRDIIQLFADLEVFESVLLKSGVREVIFRKPAAG